MDAPSRLDILKALGDNTRYAIYLELARSPVPLSTAEVADVLDLHVNTVRPHLERMREVGLLEVRTEQRREVGRPQHLYALAEDAPTLGLESSAFAMMARLLLGAAAEGGLDPGDLAEAGRVQGEADAARWPEGTAAITALVGEQTRLGFDPEVVELDGGSLMAFAHCPFRDLAEAHPDLVCQMHCGLVDGLVGAMGGAEVVRFNSLVDRAPCQVELALS